MYSSATVLSAATLTLICLASASVSIGTIGYCTLTMIDVAAFLSLTLAALKAHKKQIAEIVEREEAPRSPLPATAPRITYHLSQRLEEEIMEERPSSPLEEELSHQDETLEIDSEQEEETFIFPLDLDEADSEATATTSSIVEGALSSSSQDTLQVAAPLPESPAVLVPLDQQMADYMDAFAGFLVAISNIYYTSRKDREKNKTRIEEGFSTVKGILVAHCRKGSIKETLEELKSALEIDLIKGFYNCFSNPNWAYSKNGPFNNAAFKKGVYSSTTFATFGLVKQAINSLCDQLTIINSQEKEACHKACEKLLDALVNPFYYGAFDPTHRLRIRLMNFFQENAYPKVDRDASLEDYLTAYTTFFTETSTKLASGK